MSQYHEDEDYESMDEDYAPVPNDARIAGQIDTDGHLQSKDLYGVQKKTFFMTISGSLEQIAANQARTKWNMSNDIQKQLKQVTTATNRARAADEHLVGDLSKAVMLQATVLEQSNDFPIPIGVNIPGLVPSVYTKDNRYCWVINKNTPTTALQQSIFEPDNVFTRYMYEKLQKLDVETLKEQVRFDIDPSGKNAVFDPNGFAWDVLMKNVYQGKFPGAEDYLMNLDAQVANNPRSFRPEVPTDIAREVYDAIEAPLRDIEESFVDLRKLNATFERADGEHWNSFGGLIGAAAGLDKDSETYMREHTLATPYSATLKVQVEYIMY